MSNKSAIGDLAGILGGPPAPPVASVVAPVKPPRRAVEAPPKPTAAPQQPQLLDDGAEKSDRITALLPISVLAQLETRVASLRRKKKVSVSGYIEAAVRELLDRGEHDLEVLEKHRITARRVMSRNR